MLSRLLLLASIIVSAYLHGQDINEPIVTFTPPSGWHATQSNEFSSVKFMVVGKSEGGMPPSMNLATQKYDHSLKDYLKIVKNINDAQGYDWKDLGTINTLSGKASLSQVDTKSEWGTLRLMHVILLKDKQIYILTASAMKEEFPKYYKDFFSAFKSFKINHSILDIFTKKEDKKIISDKLAALKSSWNEYALTLKKDNNEDASPEKLFNDTDFQNSCWLPFVKLIDEKSVELGDQVKEMFLQKIENELYQSYNALSV